MRLNFDLIASPIQRSAGTLGTLGTTSNGKALSRPRLPGECGDTWGQRTDLSPLSPSCPQSPKAHKPSIHAVVPNVPAVPTKKQLSESEGEAFEERAAIMEFDGGLSRDEAERLAAESLGL